MSPTAMLAAAAAAVTGLLMLLVAFLYHEGDKKTLRIGEQGADLRAAEVVEEYRDKMDKLTAEYAEKLDKTRRQDATEIGDLRAQANEWKLDAAKRAREDPFSFGDSLHNFFVGSMCRIAAGLDAEARAACNSIASDAYTPGVSLAVTVTPELAEHWAYRCELRRDSVSIKDEEARTEFDELHKVTDADADFCHWSITGFTPAGAGIIKDWWLSTEYHILELTRWVHGTKEQVGKINDTEISGGR